MTREEKWELAIGAGIVAIVCLLAYKHGQSGAESNTPLQIPSNNANVANYQPASNLGSIAVNYQPGNQYQIDVGAATSPSTGNGTLCSCGCNNSASFFDMNQLLQSYADALNNDTSQYLKTLLSSIPATISQFINNPTGYEQALGVYGLLDTTL